MSTNRSRRSAAITMIVVLLVSLLGAASTLLFHKKPSLGLDLAGGVSVVLDPYKDGKPQKNVPKARVDKSIEIIRSRVDSIGVAEPEISSQGSSILVQIPGITDTQRALDLMGRTAELRFRPVLSSQTIPAPDPARVKELRKKLGLPDGVSAVDVVTAETGQDPTAPPTSAPAATTPPAETVPTTIDLSPTVPPTTAAGATATSEGALGSPVTIAGRFGAAVGAQTPTSGAPTATTAPPTSAPATTAAAGATTTTAPEATTTSVIKNEWGIDISSEEFGELYQLEQASSVSDQVTKPEDDKNEATVTLLGSNGTELYQLGPVYSQNGKFLTGAALSGASAGLGGQNGSEWAVFPKFRSGPTGIDLFNGAAEACYNGDATCPTNGGEVGRLAIVLDGEVLTAPNINPTDKTAGKAFQPYTVNGGLEISGSFTEQSAKDVATALEFGALPLELRPSSAQNVSATLGEGALKAALISGVVGLIVLVVYMLMYYRALGLVTLVGLVIAGCVLWTFVSYIGASLTLAGIVGIIVSIGISLDSNVVFFENLKEMVRGGRTVRSAVNGAFSSAFSTIVKADISSLIGAGVLYALTAGPVKGFAAFLFITTAIDIIQSWFWMRNATVFLANGKLGSNPMAFGIPTDDAGTPLPGERRGRSRRGSASVLADATDESASESDSDDSEDEPEPPPGDEAAEPDADDGGVPDAEDDTAATKEVE